MQEHSLKRKRSRCDLGSGRDEIDGCGGVASVLPQPLCKGSNIGGAEPSDGDALAWLMDPGDENTEPLGVAV